MILEIVILAMIAAFLGLRLYSVLGQRAEHEEETLPSRFESPDADKRDEQPAARVVPAPTQGVPNEGFVPVTERGVREIAAADRTFDIITFVEGAKGAYEMILEAFWKGDKDTLRELCDDDVYASFAGAIDARSEAGHQLENTLIRVEETRIEKATLDGLIARIEVLFIADIAAVTRDKDGTVIAGSLDDAVESRDIWTFQRHVEASSPHWLLVETDEG